MKSTQDNYDTKMEKDNKFSEKDIDLIKEKLEQNELENITNSDSAFDEEIDKKLNDIEQNKNNKPTLDEVFDMWDKSINKTTKKRDLKEMISFVFDMDRTLTTYEYDDVQEYFKDNGLSVSEFNKAYKLELTKHELNYTHIPTSARELVLMEFNKRELVVMVDGSVQTKNILAIDSEFSDLTSDEFNKCDYETQSQLKSYGHDTIVRWDFLVDDLNYINENYKFGLQRTNICSSMDIIRESKKKETLGVISDRLMFDVTVVEGAEAEWEKVARILIGDNEDELHLTICKLKHVVWQIKKKLLHQYVYNPMMVVLYGRQEIGKTTFWKRFFNVLNEYNGTTNSKIEELDDDRYYKRFTDYPVVVLDEVDDSKNKKTNVDMMDSIKRHITSDYIEPRKLHSHNIDKYWHMATYVGGTNKPLYQLIKDPTGMRRFLEIECIDEKFDIETCRSINSELLFKSIDHSVESPITKVIDTVRTEQEGLRYKKAVERWIIEYSESIKIKEENSQTEWFKIFDLWQIDNVHERHRITKEGFRDQLIAIMKTNHDKCFKVTYKDKIKKRVKLEITPTDNDHGEPYSGIKQPTVEHITHKKKNNKINHDVLRKVLNNNIR